MQEDSVENDLTLPAADKLDQGMATATTEQGETTKRSIEKDVKTRCEHNQKQRELQLLQTSAARLSTEIAENYNTEWDIVMLKRLEGKNQVSQSFLAIGRHR